MQIYASADTTDGLLMKGRLETEGIPVMVKGESEGPYRMGPTYLWVPAEREARARAIVDAVRAGAFAVAEDVDRTEFPTTRRRGRSASSVRISASSTAAPCGPSSGRTCDVPSHEHRG